MPGLPPGWEKVLDRNSGQYYFYNARLGVTQWDPPQVGAQKTKATFVTTTTRTKKVGEKTDTVGLSTSTCTTKSCATN